MLEFRLATEGEAAAIAAYRRTAQQEAAISAAHRKMARAIDAGETTVDADYEFHTAIAIATNNRFYLEALRQFGSRSIPRGQFPTLPETGMRIIFAKCRRNTMQSCAPSSSRTRMRREKPCANICLRANVAIACFRKRNSISTLILFRAMSYDDLHGERRESMYVGTQVAARDDEDFKVWAQLGVKNISADPPGKPASWVLDDFERLRDKVESFGLVLDMVQLPLPSRPIEQASYPDILLAGPERDRQIDAVCIDDREYRQGRHSGSEIQSQPHRHSTHGNGAWPRRFAE